MATFVGGRPPPLPNTQVGQSISDVPRRKWDTRPTQGRPLRVNKPKRDRASESSFLRQSTETKCDIEKPPLSSFSLWLSFSEEERERERGREATADGLGGHRWRIRKGTREEKARTKDGFYARGRAGRKLRSENLVWGLGKKRNLAFNWGIFCFLKTHLGNMISNA